MSRRSIKLLLSALAVSSIIISSVSAEKKIYPWKDGSAGDSSLSAAIEDLKTIVKNKDTAGLVRYLDKDIQVGFGGDDPGIESFKKIWGLNKDSATSDLWKSLGRILNWGGSYSSSGEKSEYYSIPYYYNNFPGGEDFSALIVGEKIRLRSGPGRKFDPIDSVDFALARSATEDGSPASETIDGETWEWVKVETQSGKKGYVFGKYLYSEFDLRAGFQKKDGKWKMIFLVVGD